MSASACLQCGNAPTIRAHLIPQAFAREVRNGANTFAVTKGMTTTFRPTQNGLFDDGILCRDCDNKLGSNEKYAFEMLGHARQATQATTNTHVACSPLSGDRLIRFAAGITWKFCVTKPDYGRIDTGPYVDTLRNVAFDDAAIPPSIDMFMIRLRAVAFEEQFFRMPKPDRQGSVNFVRMTLGAFVMFIKTDQRPPPNVSVPEIWMKGRTEVVFPVLPMHLFEEGRFVRDAWRRDPKLARFTLKNLGLDLSPREH